MFFRLLFFVISLIPLFANDSITPAVIIGGGVGGGTAALYLARAGLHPVVVEGASPGGALIQSEAIENWPGLMKISGAQLMDEIRNQAEANGALYLHEEVVSIDFKKRPFTIITRSLANPKEQRILRAQTCIIATGSTPNTLSIPGEQSYWGHGISTCAICDGSQYKDKKVGVVGGGDAAVLEGLYLSNLANEVTLFVRKDHFKATDEKRKRSLLSRPNVTVLYDTTVEEIKGDGHMISAVKIKEPSTIREVSLDGVFLAIGSQPNTSLFKGQIDLDSHGFILVKRGQKTSVPGVYAIGDASDPVDQQAISAAGDAAKAALAVQRELSSLPVNAPVIAATPQIEVKNVTTPAQLQEELNSPLPTLVDFYANWCGPCRRLAPKFEAASVELAGKVKFLKVNVDLSGELCRIYQIKAMPTVLFFKNGTLLERKIGEPEILELISRLL